MISSTTGKWICFAKISDFPCVELEQYCICKREEFGDMIFCDNKTCSIGWWHYSCANVKRKPRGSWYCPCTLHQAISLTASFYIS